MAQFSNMGGQQTTPSPKKPSECNKCKANGFPEQYITFLPDIDPMTGKQKANTFTNKPAWIILNYGDRSKHEHRISVEQQHIQPLQQSETEAKQQVTQNIENAMKENSNNQITSSLDNLYSYMENGFKTVEGMQTRLEGIDRQTLVIDGEIEELKTEVINIKHMVTNIQESFKDFVKTYGIKPSNELIRKDTNPSVHVIEGFNDTTKMDTKERLPSDLDDVVEE